MGWAGFCLSELAGRFFCFWFLASLYLFSLPLPPPGSWPLDWYPVPGLCVTVCVAGVRLACVGGLQNYKRQLCKGSYSRQL